MSVDGAATTDDVDGVMSVCASLSGGVRAEDGAVEIFDAVNEAVEREEVNLVFVDVVVEGTNV